MMGQAFVSFWSGKGMNDRSSSIAGVAMDADTARVRNSSEVD